MNLLPYLQKGIEYAGYIQKVNEQLQKLKTEGDTSGYAHYYELGLARMERIHKTFQLNDEQKKALKDIDPNFELLTISEGWCGDASQILPVADVVMKELGVQQKIVFRDENPELMDAYLTDGARSIPILIGVDTSGYELFRFGPRPAHGMDLLRKHKENPEAYNADQFHKDLQVWYNQDKGESIVRELVQVMKS